VLGVVGGFASVAFVKLLLSLRAWFARLPRSTQWIQPVAGGLTVGLFGYFVPQVMGVGYDQVSKVLNGDLVLRIVILLAILKIVATAVCYASGNAGGIFGPSLFIGAMVGAAVGSVGHHIFPASTGGAGAYALVGMGTAFAGIIRTPLTSVLMIFELTRDYTIIVPLMISNLIAFFISQKLQKEPIYEALAQQDGLHLPARPSATQTAELNVGRVMRPAAELVTPWMTEPEAPHLHLDQSLGKALAIMGQTGYRILPVVSRADAKNILGVVTLSDVLKGYGLSHESRMEDASP
jgi:CIC family chloride channel protein